MNFPFAASCLQAFCGEQARQRFQCALVFFPTAMFRTTSNSAEPMSMSYNASVSGLMQFVPIRDMPHAIRRHRVESGS